MQLSKGGVVAVGAAAAAFFAVMISYAPQDMKALTAAQVASGYYAVDDWQTWDGYGGYDSYDYAYDPRYGYGNGGYVDPYMTSYEYDRTGYYSGGSFYDDYYEEYWYDDYPRTSGWGYGGSVSPFPAISTAFANIIPAAARAVTVTNPAYYYYQQPVIVPTYRTSYAVPPMPVPQPQPRLPQPSCSIVANPSVVTSGGTATLTWGSQYGTAATLDTVGSVPTNGSRTITGITSARTYGLAVTGPGGTGACYAFIALRAAAPEMTCLISTNPAIIARGEVATLAWGTTGAVSATMAGGGSQGTVPLSGSIAIVPGYSTNYTISLRDAYGNTQSCTTGILVQ
ncbi:hypothetical protein FJY94_01900 [Candidatus Kaiserbacteria bacterium]|nr:hypothetical protein [Candidatus Kaiserbacteria bacterium]